MTYAHVDRLMTDRLQPVLHVIFAIYLSAGSVSSVMSHLCVFYLQLQYPVYWDLMEFCDGFRKLLDHLQLDKVSVLPSSFC